MTKFNVGDKVRIIRDLYPHLLDKEGVITEDDGTSTTPYRVYLESGASHWKYGHMLELVTPATPPAQKKSARITALETQVAELQAKVDALESAGKYPLTTQFNRLVDVKVDRILADIERKAKPKTQLPNEQRADVIKRAKAFVADAKRTPSFGGEKAYLNSVDGGKTGHWCNVEFLVNADKRTVVALMRWRYDNSVTSRGIAKCDPDDVFNADIGKAIALARALGVEVPTEFVKAVQPTEFVLGHRLYVSTQFPNELVADRTSVDKGAVRLSFIKTHENDGETRIIDDTDAVYE